jgi:hypothetical protein
MHNVVEPGIFEVMVGPSSDQTKTVTIAVTGAMERLGSRRHQRLRRDRSRSSQQL